jgi:hypothetical protein
MSVQNDRYLKCQLIGRMNVVVCNVSIQYKEDNSVPKRKSFPFYNKSVLANYFLLNDKDKEACEVEIKKGVDNMNSQSGSKCSVFSLDQKKIHSERSLIAHIIKDLNSDNSEIISQIETICQSNTIKYEIIEISLDIMSTRNICDQCSMILCESGIGLVKKIEDKLKKNTGIIVNCKALTKNFVFSLDTNESISTSGFSNCSVDIDNPRTAYHPQTIVDRYKLGNDIPAKYTIFVNDLDKSKEEKIWNLFGFPYFSVYESVLHSYKDFQDNLHDDFDKKLDVEKCFYAVINGDYLIDPLFGISLRKSNYKHRLFRGQIYKPDINDHLEHCTAALSQEFSNIVISGFKEKEKKSEDVKQFWNGNKEELNKLIFESEDDINKYIVKRLTDTQSTSDNKDEVFKRFFLSIFESARYLNNELSE